MLVAMSGTALMTDQEYDEVIAHLDDEIAQLSRLARELATTNNYGTYRKLVEARDRRQIERKLLSSHRR